MEDALLPGVFAGRGAADLSGEFRDKRFLAPRASLVQFRVQAFPRWLWRPCLAVVLDHLPTDSVATAVCLPFVELLYFFIRFPANGFYFGVRLGIHHARLAFNVATALRPLLQRGQAARRFAVSHHGPPLDTGMMWSTWLAASVQPAAWIWHM